MSEEILRMLHGTYSMHLCLRLSIVLSKILLLLLTKFNHLLDNYHDTISNVIQYNYDDEDYGYDNYKMIITN